MTLTELRELLAKHGKAIDDIEYHLRMGGSGGAAEDIARFVNCADELLNVVSAAQNYFTEDFDSGIDMSSKWFKSYTAAKEALAALSAKLEKMK